MGLSADFFDWLKSKQELVNRALEFYVPYLDGQARRLFEAMHYSLMSGGKRLRPILVMAGAEAAGGKPEDVLPAACAIECIHTYSLIHDDLPAMDDDDLRRGKPTCHKAFDEATAILAGDGLLTHAFRLLAHEELADKFPQENLLEGIRLVAEAAGLYGMVAGQMADLLAEGRNVTAEELAFIHRHKTAALIRASVLLGATLVGTGKKEKEALSSYGWNIGHAFQIIDDILDLTADEKTLGKPIGSDLKKKKATYPALFGLEASRAKARSLLEEALSSIAILGDKAKTLADIAYYVLERKL
ncbi:Polyprenyl synthetase [Thermodesulfatator indicus DSM 15286]|uniref:Polyprenyl synthetase n=1 Tax=Thermodesulfatator indicus (strain DSM 15286 / JCM 11887 / CIR29812) TaxID=667014 RepID=F8AAI0_THEID|nr:farnesyl diphosphate synthase [Thermodesulfatator indicus]AEH45400.1 Polyprenyl synthetase [Thermodesulfatator indicus DSM 15286]